MDELIEISKDIKIIKELIEEGFKNII